MNRRNAVTLTEVLIAIFVLSIGLMALLSLFPLGAAQMAQALKDQRTAETAAIAGPSARIAWKEACRSLPNSPGNPQFTDPNGQPASVQRGFYAMDDPNLNNTFGGPTGPYVLPPSVVSKTKVFRPLPDMISLVNGIPGSASIVSSYPVFVDPIGWEANARMSATNRTLWVGYPLVGNPPTPIYQTVLVGGVPKKLFGAIPRRPLYVRNPDPNPAAAPWVALGATDPNNVLLRSTQRLLSRFSLLDDMGFNVDGTPDRDGNPNTYLHDNKDKGSPLYEGAATIQREGRYTWSYMFRRPSNNDPKNRGNVEMTVVVYSGRSVDVPSPEEQYVATAPTAATALGRYQLVINMNDPQHLTPVRKPKPAVRRGSWILDATIFNDNGMPQPQGYFYRVTNVDDSDPTQIKFDVQQDLSVNSSALNRVIVVMENVVEVFPKGIVTANSPPGDPVVP
jgi:hypothetical protein